MVKFNIAKNDVLKLVCLTVFKYVKLKIMNLIIRILIFLSLATSCLTATAEVSMHELENQGTLYRLSGDFESASSIERGLIDNFDQPSGHVFALNTIITHLTWDETQIQYDEDLLDHADRTLKWCEPRLDSDTIGAVANYYCGQASFALAYYHGLRGNYIAAGTSGTKSINYLEAALLKDPSLIDAKMHLGVGYFVADNLPPFIKMFSRVI